MRLENGYYAPRADGLDVIPNRNYLQARLIWDTLAAAGVRHVVISPGSRSTPLAQTAERCGSFETFVLTDERVAGFYALGLCKGVNAPVALLCTSGTAPAHYYAAVIEAAQSGYPLIVVSADRPRRLRNQGAPQTIDQVALFGRYPKMALDLDEASLDSAALGNMLVWLERGLRAMQNAPCGPLHINVPTDEPLIPVDEDAQECAALYEALRGGVTKVETPAPATIALSAKHIEAVESCFCGLIVCGPDSARNESERNAIHRLARALGWPLLADAASGVRDCGEPNLPCYDLFLRRDELAALAPDFVIEFGLPPTSKTLTNYLNTHRAKTLRLQRDLLPRDPDGRATEVLIGDVAEYCAQLGSRVKVSRDSLLLDPFWRAAGSMRTILGRLAEFPQAELAFVHAALEALPDGANLVLASSMSIRYADTAFVPSGKRIHVFAQRGTNGIDGVVSHAAGIAHATQRPTLLVCGDLAFLHDLGGWMAARACENLRVLLLNNNGGGIFSFLPVAKQNDTFEKLHGTPLDIELSGLSKVFRMNWTLCDKPADVARCCDWQARGATTIEVRSNRFDNVEAHTRFVQLALEALD